jgi:hypothetical protein
MARTTWVRWMGYLKRVLKIGFSRKSRKPMVVIRLFLWRRRRN